MTVAWGAQSGPAVVVPVKSFEVAKGRLAGTLSPEQRQSLARAMAEGVLAAARPHPVWVVCHDHAIARWAMDHGARVLWLGRSGLNEAIGAAIDFLGRLGHDRVIVAHGDLPLARSLAWVGEFDGVTVVPDRRQEGTNVLVVPTAAEFTLGYGPGSAERHWAEAERRDLDVRLVHDQLLGWDVDVAEDLAVFLDEASALLDSV